MRRIPLYVLTILVGLVLAYVFISPFYNGLPSAGVSGQDVTIVPENFEVPDDMDGNSSDTPSPQQETAPPGAQTTPAARQVDPDGFSFAGKENAPLQRIEPRQPLGEIGHASPPPPPPPPVPVDTTARPKLLYRPVATAAGTVEASGYKIAVEGIDVVPPEETCAVDGGSSWPCGMAARTAFRNWLRSRAIECNVPDQPPEALLATQCKLGTMDLATWLVDNGWARTADGTPMAENMKKAAEAKRGIFGSPPPTLPAIGDLPPLEPSGDTPLPSPEPQPAPPAAVPDAPFPAAPQ
ncbi:thermonuclease family protein [Phyllobacterium myrsinacearum]|uniref:Endonuclease YncB(Thermonuclease family) n=1 Tax=Phyllobacterium myrsinacearum TaxID=28101 RepID=A0A839EI93_9HYPH|nr:thermonuclease family protein [Phyllobacterium myrsinacearum]MBA8877206.1 endonuclease YncB(thermonuclease family) [Phyllobacterium myrsinacearum]